ncbi:hypothetical protein [Streptomyces sp. NRRL F-2664]|uniref:hypothetical protein n=1 Tax=Streptomyces sp. NRRL F-2664 TaxID=1463842 RepID=UPI0004CB304A|nr:hypothetical protein [Streptomyces sp. NRRL F-2664]
MRDYRDEYLFCSFTSTFEPGTYHRLDTGLNLTATPQLWRDSFYVSWNPGGKPAYKPQQGGVEGTAAALKVAPSEPFKEWPFWGREVSVENPANQPDFTVHGATGSGPAGGQVLLDPGWQIKGTGSAATTAADDNAVETEFVLPSGISFVAGRPGRSPARRRPPRPPRARPPRPPPRPPPPRAPPRPPATPPARTAAPAATWPTPAPPHSPRADSPP